MLWKYSTDDGVWGVLGRRCLFSWNLEAYFQFWFRDKHAFMYFQMKPLFILFLRHVAAFSEQWLWELTMKLNFFLLTFKNSLWQRWWRWWKCMHIASCVFHTKFFFAFINNFIPRFFNRKKSRPTRLREINVCFGNRA